VELRGEQEVSYELARKDAAGLLQFLTLNGVLGDAAAQAAARRRCRRRCAQPRRWKAWSRCMRRTPDSGLHPRAGRAVAAGDAMADLIDPVSGAVTVVRATVDGVFFARSAHRHVIRGMNVGKVAGAKAYREGDLLSC
jgi:predicted deacylase